MALIRLSLVMATANEHLIDKETVLVFRGSIKDVGILHDILQGFAKGVGFKPAPEYKPNAERLKEQIAGGMQL